ncbi:MAG: helix-turn-helix domain-containing protein [Candidatus Latescibacteria bacterium]|nr:helix-turn-helix domain-containing protein [Candidatus Latescibacterota bacterium]NIO78074.1 helix-turn-helix domain-containing protein [Candidatus Latescibacterota bacterium]
MQVNRSKLIELREARGLSQTKLAQRSDLNPATIGRLENDSDYQPNFFTVQKIAVALGCSSFELLEEGNDGDQATHSDDDSRTLVNRGSVN